MLNMRLECPRGHLLAHPHERRYLGEELEKVSATTAGGFDLEEPQEALEVFDAGVERGASDGKGELAGDEGDGFRGERDLWVVLARLGRWGRNVRCRQPSGLRP